MSGLLESTLGAVGQVGEAVDKVTGGRALRGALAGKPRELASFVPFSDSMGLTDAKDKISGRDLTDAYGVTGKGDHSFGANAAGFLADTVLSPANMLGGAAAFKAAPTVAKGLAAGAKAVSGLDLIDHIGAGAKALGSGAKSLGGKLSRHVEMPDGPLIHALGTVASDDDIRRAAGGGMGFVPDESAALKYHVPHKPIDTDALHAETLPANASRPRRWSADPAERAYYSADRGRRYAERMSGREIPNPAGGPATIPTFSLNDAFKKFASDDSGALKIGGGDSPLQHLPWAGRADITDTTRNAANWSGPGFGGGRDKIQGILDAGNASKISAHFDTLRKGLLGHPGLAKIASEFPEDTKFLGHGAEALAGLSGDGHVIRAAPAQSWLGSSGRADIPEIVQPFRSIQIPGNKKLGASPWVVEHLPRVNPIVPGEAKLRQVRDLLAAVQRGGDRDAIAHGYNAVRSMGHMPTDASGIGWDLTQAVKGAHPGLDPWDFNPHNISLTNEGLAIGHDGGMARPFGGGEISRHPATVATDSAKAKAAKLGGQDAVREAMANGLARGTAGQGVGAGGGIIGLPEAVQRQSLVNSFLEKYGHMADPSAASLPGVTGFQSAPNALAREFANAPVARPSSSFAIHSAGTDRLHAAGFPNRQSGLLGAMAKANPTGDLPWERAVRLGKEAGVPTSLVPPDEAALILARGGLVGPAGETPLAWYAGKPNTIGLNGNHAAWTDKALMNRLLGEKGPSGSKWFASDVPDAVMHHELGHSMHRQGLGLDEYSNSPRLEGFGDPNHAKYLERNLSRYSATDPYEGVAETVSALKGNQQFNPSVQQGLSELLRHYGGNSLWQMLGDQKLLRPLGYSLLATLGVGGAASQQQGA